MSKGSKRKEEEGTTRIAVVNADRCKPKKCKQECKKNCPVNRQGKMCIDVKPSSKIAFISEILCIGCNICTKKCPFEAISIINLPKNLESCTTHRFGPNSFKLHRLPIPRASQVLGLVGTNGIGKSTALKILAGKLKPNLGNFRDEPDWQEILKYYRGSELQNYFTRILEDDLKAVMKPQYVDHIPKKIKGTPTVKEVLKKKDERGVYDEVINALDLHDVLDRMVPQLSGGELQRFAIAAAVLRDQDVYMFDEPSSYLDVKQRLKAGKLIRSLVSPEEEKRRMKKEGKLKSAYVIVVEHDLAILDYLSDYVCVLYGHPGAFGVVTMPFGVREGINVFLAGHIPTENMRFRETELVFKVTDTSTDEDAKDDAKEKEAAGKDDKDKGTKDKDKDKEKTKDSDKGKGADKQKGKDDKEKDLDVADKAKGKKGKKGKAADANDDGITEGGDKEGQENAKNLTTQSKTKVKTRKRETEEEDEEENDKDARSGGYAYPSMNKTLGSFHLSVEGGRFRDSQIIVMLGENGTGKTTFVKMLAGLEFPDEKECKIPELKVSYKPQKISPNFEGTVVELLHKRIRGNYMHPQFQTDVVKPLHIEELYDRKVLTLSGGELQRVALVLALGTPADLYLIDEPSAYLDSEQRILASKVIKRYIYHVKKAAFIVEHDFIMATYLGDRVIVFDGVPAKDTRAMRPQSLTKGMNMFLKNLDVTFRRDPNNFRPRINKNGSQKDQEQKLSGNYFFDCTDD